MHEAIKVGQFNESLPNGQPTIRDRAQSIGKTPFHGPLMGLSSDCGAAKMVKRIQSKPVASGSALGQQPCFVMHLPSNFTEQHVRLAAAVRRALPGIQSVKEH